MTAGGRARRGLPRPQYRQGGGQRRQLHHPPRQCHRGQRWCRRRAPPHCRRLHLHPQLRHHLNRTKALPPGPTAVPVAVAAVMAVRPSAHEGAGAASKAAVALHPQSPAGRRAHLPSPKAPAPQCQETTIDPGGRPRAWAAAGAAQRGAVFAAAELSEVDEVAVVAEAVDLAHRCPLRRHRHCSQMPQPQLRMAARSHSSFDDAPPRQQPAAHAPPMTPQPTPPTSARSVPPPQPAAATQPAGARSPPAARGAPGPPAARAPPSPAAARAQPLPAAARGRLPAAGQPSHGPGRPGWPARPAPARPTGVVVRDQAAQCRCCRHQQNAGAHQSACCPLAWHCPHGGDHHRHYRHQCRRRHDHHRHRRRHHHRRWCLHHPRKWARHQASRPPR